MPTRLSTNSCSDKEQPGRTNNTKQDTHLHMKPKWMTAIALCAMAVTACNEDTLEIGSSLIDENDLMEVSTGIYEATSRSVLADSVYARSYDCYIGNVKDPETGAYIKSEFMAQFNMMEGLELPPEETICASWNEHVAADSCEIWLYFNKDACYGDTLVPLKLNVLELKEPMSDNKSYYSNYDPKSEGYIRQDGIKKSMAFSLANLTYKDSVRNLSTYADIARITLNDPYTDKNGHTHNNYGTYILRNYYEHPEYFKNSYTFTNRLCPGFYFEVNDGLGMMANLQEIDMKVFYSYKPESTKINAALTTSSTPEVLQTTQIINDKAALQRLVSEDECTYLKAPAGIYTELTLPVDEIKLQHANDSLLSVSLALQRLNSGIQDNHYLFDAPEDILMVMKDSVYKFFEKGETINYESNYYSTLLNNQYDFGNIENMVTKMAQNKSNGLKEDPNWVANHPNWNKVLLVPITIITNVSSTTTNTANSVSLTISNEMALSTTKLEGGPKGKKIEVKVIYAKFKNN